MERGEYKNIKEESMMLLFGAILEPEAKGEIRNTDVVII